MPSNVRRRRTDRFAAVAVSAGRAATVLGVLQHDLGRDVARRAAGAQHALRQSFVFTDTPVMSQPEMKIPSAAPLFDASAKLTDDNTRQHVKKFLEAFSVWINRFKD